MKEFIEKLNDRNEEKVKVTSLEIIVTGTNDKPYFKIKYKEVGKEYYNIGYSSYYLNKVFDWKEKYFEIVNELAEEHKGGWIPCSERLPENGQKVLVYREDGHSSGMSAARFIKGKTKEELESMEHPRYCFEDQWGNNLRPYAWDGDGPMKWFGQDVIAWQPLPEAYQPKGEQ